MNKSLWFGMTKRWYDSSRWRKCAKIHLDSNPICIYCLRRGMDNVSATIVHHRIPHKGNYDLFWDATNWESVCATCHSGILQKAEKGGIVPGCDTNGNPLDRNHHWNK